MEKRNADYVSILVLTGCVLWFCQDLLIHGEVPFYRDLTNYFYPLRYSLYESYRNGELPLWDRHFAQGFPNLAAFQPGALYPPHLIFAFLPFYLSIRSLFIFHFLLAAIGTYKLLRRWNYSRDLSLVGSLLFTLGGLIVSLSNLLNHFQTAVWLPWLILVWERALLIPKWSNLVAFTAVAALQLLAGSPELFAMSMGLAILDGLRMRESEPRVSSVRMVSIAFAGNLLMLAIVMAQFLPTVELIMESRRGRSIPAAEAFMWSLDPFSLLNFFFLDREVQADIGVGISFFFTKKVPLLVSSYLGLISLYGIALWVYYAPYREKIFLTALTLGSLAMALGNNSLIYPFLFRYIPCLAAFRFPEKFFFITYAAIFIMTMRGLRELLLDQTSKLKAPVIILGSISLAWLAVYLTFWFHSEIVADFIAANSNIPPLTDIHARATVSVLANLQRQTILSLAFCSLLILVKADKIRPALFSVLLVCAVYVDLAWAHKSFLFPIHPDRLHATPPVIEPSVNPLTRFFFYPSAHDLHPAFFTVLAQPTFEQAVGLSFQNYLPNVGVSHGIDYFQEIDAIGRRAYNDFLTFANPLELDSQVKLLRTFNVSHVVSFRELPQKGIHLVNHFPKYFSWLYRVEGAVPRAYVVNKAIIEKDPLKALRRISLAEFDPIRQVVLDNEIPIRPTRRLEAQAKIQQYENRLVTIEATSNDDGILVLADSFYPGWKAFVDGNQAKIIRANHFYRAVMLPKGEHRIEFRYEPQSFKLGLIISMFTLIGMGVVSLCVFVKQRNLPARSPVSPIEILQN